MTHVQTSVCHQDNWKEDTVTRHTLTEHKRRRQDNNRRKHISLNGLFHLQFGSHVLYPFLFVDLVCRVLSYYYSISIAKSLEAHCKFQTLCWGISDKLVWSSCDAKRFPNCKIHSEFNVSDSQVVNVTASWSYISYDFIWVIIWVSYESYSWTIFVSKKSGRSVKK